MKFKAVIFYIEIRIMPWIWFVLFLGFFVGVDFFRCLLLLLFEVFVCFWGCRLCVCVFLLFFFVVFLLLFEVFWGVLGVSFVWVCL